MEDIRFLIFKFLFSQEWRTPKKNKNKKHYEDFRKDGIESNIYIRKYDQHSRMLAIVLFLFSPLKSQKCHLEYCTFEV